MYHREQKKEIFLGRKNNKCWNKSIETAFIRTARYNNNNFDRFQHYPVIRFYTNAASCSFRWIIARPISADNGPRCVQHSGPLAREEKRSNRPSPWRCAISSARGYLVWWNNYSFGRESCRILANGYRCTDPICLGAGTKNTIARRV